MSEQSPIEAFLDELTTGADYRDQIQHLEVIPSQPAIPSRYLDPKAKTRSRQHYERANLQAARIDYNNGQCAVLMPVNIQSK